MKWFTRNGLPDLTWCILERSVVKKMKRKQTVAKVDFMERVIPSSSTDFYVRDFTFQFCLRDLLLFTKKKWILLDLLIIRVLTQ